MTNNSASTEVGQQTAGNDISVARLTTFDAIDSLRKEWQDLKDILMPGSIHADIDWFLTIVRLGPQPRTPLVITFRRDKQLVGLIAGFRHVREVLLKIGYLRLGRFTAPTFSTNYHCCLALPDASQYLHKTMTAALQAECSPLSTGLVYVNALPVNDPLYRSLVRAPLSKGLVLAYPPARHMMMSLAPTMEETIANRGPSVRAALRRIMNKRDRSNKNNVFSTRIFTRTEELDAYFADAERVAKKTYQRALKVGFETTPLHRTQVELAVKKGWFRGHVLYSGNTPIAFQEDYLCGHHVFNPYVGYDPAYSDTNPGTMLLINSWEALSYHTNAANYDFGFGEGVYKERLADNCLCEGWLV
jgi:hypothetical protein